MKVKAKTKNDLVLYTLIILVAIFFLAGHILNWYCSNHPSYWSDSICFDIDFRCEIECGFYGLNYTGKLGEKAYLCDCGSVYVSICTGSIINKTSENKIIGERVGLYKELLLNGSFGNETYVLYEEVEGRGLCPLGTNYSQVTCVCAKNTKTPCMALCFVCVNSSVNNSNQVYNLSIGEWDDDEEE